MRPSPPSRVPIALAATCAVLLGRAGAQEPAVEGPADRGEGGAVLSAVGLPPQPDDLADLVIPWQHVDEDRLDAERRIAWEQMVGYGGVAREVLVGSILSYSEYDTGMQSVLLEVERVLRGGEADLVEFTIQALGGTEDMEQVPARIVDGYRVLVFLDPSRGLVEGNAMYLVEGGCAWRNKRSGLFLRPRSDRVWIDDIDPSENWVVFTMEEVEDSLRGAKARRKRNRTW